MRGHAICAVLDISKTYDRVYHQGLLFEMKPYWFLFKILRLFEAVYDILGPMSEFLRMFKGYLTTVLECDKDIQGVKTLQSI